MTQPMDLSELQRLYTEGNVERAKLEAENAGLRELLISAYNHLDPFYSALRDDIRNAFKRKE